MNEQNSIVDHQSHKDDETDHRQQIQCLERKQIKYAQRDNTANRRKWQAKNNDQAVSQ